MSKMKLTRESGVLLFGTFLIVAMLFVGLFAFHMVDTSMSGSNCLSSGTLSMCGVNSLVHISLQSFLSVIPGQIVNYPSVLVFAFFVFFVARNLRHLIPTVFFKRLEIGSRATLSYVILIRTLFARGILNTKLF